MSSSQTRIVIPAHDEYATMRLWRERASRGRRANPLARWMTSPAWAKPNPNQSRPEPVSGEIR